jgi:Lipopolysaccharide-assembly
MIYTPYTSQHFKKNIWVVLLFIATTLLFSSCGPYTFKDVSIPPEIKTIKVSFIENRAPYKNPQLSPRLTDQLQQKISNLTRRTVVTTDNADYQISGYISSYNVSTAAISSQQASANRLTVGVHMTLFNSLENKSTEYDVSRDFDFSAGLTLAQAEAQLFDEIVKNVTDEIFNRLFSNW